MTDEYWRDKALCKDSNPKVWFPAEVGQSANARLAKLICGQCEVTESCLTYALEHDERWGIWGGLSANERRAIRRRGKRAAR